MHIDPLQPPLDPRSHDLRSLESKFYFGPSGSEDVRFYASRPQKHDNLQIISPTFFVKSCSRKVFTQSMAHKGIRAKVLLFAIVDMTSEVNI